MAAPAVPHTVFMVHHAPAYYIVECIACCWRVSGSYKNVTEHADQHLAAYKEKQ